MPRDPRYIPEGGSVVEITNRTLHGRYLLRPDAAGQMNIMILGALGRWRPSRQLPAVKRKRDPLRIDFSSCEVRSISKCGGCWWR